MRSTQLDHDVVGRIAILTQHRYRGIRGVFTEIAGAPFLEESLGRDVPRGSHRPVGKHNRSRAYPGLNAPVGKEPSKTLCLVNFFDLCLVNQR